MKNLKYLVPFLFAQLAAANPCPRLLEAARTLDLNTARLEYGLNELGHLKIPTPLSTSLPEVEQLFAQRPIFSRPGKFFRTRQLVFRRANGWALSEDQKIVDDEAKHVVPELKEFGMTVGRKLEDLLRRQLPAEKLVFETLMLRWTSADIELEFDGPSAELAHTDGGNVYLNSVLTLYGDGTTYWNSNEAATTGRDFDWQRITDFYPPSGQTRPGEILVLTGHRRASILNRPELTTLHLAPTVAAGAHRLLALFYFDSDPTPLK